MKNGIDHLVLCVHDLERTKNFYQQLGFTTTPRAHHPWGTDNHLIQLDGFFLELLTVARPEKVPEATAQTFSFGGYNQQFLAQREGISMLVFETNDARADREAFVAQGLPPFEPFHFKRQAKLPDGSQVEVSFTLAFATDPQMPEAVFFNCQQHAPQYFWKPDYQRHANTAQTISEVVMVAPEPATLTDFFAKVQTPEAVQMQGDTLIVDTPRGFISVLTPQAAQARYPTLDLTGFPETPFLLGYRVGVADLEAVRKQFQATDVLFGVSEDGVIQVEMNKVMIEFSK